MLVVQALARILLQMQALDADLDAFRRPCRSMMTSPSPTMGSLYWLI